MPRSWLANEGRNRAFRTALQGIVATVLLPALDAFVQVVAQALTNGGAGFNWGQVGGLALAAAMTAGTMAIAAYVHRTVVDPSQVPSALPPRPPGATAAEAPLTEPPVAHSAARADAFRPRWPDGPEKGD
jgi:hypothetical protein